MTEQQMGIDYFSLATGIKDDDKIFELKYRYGMPEGADAYDHAAAWAAYGRFVELLASIYQVGFAVEVTRQLQLRLSQQLGMTIGELDDLVATCVDVGLFDRRIWDEHHVLTSRGIQKRYFHAARRRKGKIPAEYARYILIDGADVDTMYTSEVQATPSDVDTMYTSEQQRKEKDRKGKDRRRKKTTGSSSQSEDRGRAALASIEAALTSPHGSSERDRAAPYPLACMGCLSDDGTVYADDTGTTWDTPWDALIARYRNKTGTSEATDFVRRVAAACPPGCDESPEQISECYCLLCEALDKFDRARAATPTPLALAVLEDRGKRKRSS